MPSSHLILCRPLLLLPAIPPSIRVFSNESTLRMRWPKYWSFTFSIIPSKEIPGLISFRMDWLDLLAVQGTLKGLLQHHTSKASIHQHSAFFTVQLSHPYMTTGKTIALSRWNYVQFSSVTQSTPSKFFFTPSKFYSKLPTPSPSLSPEWLIQGLVPEETTREEPIHVIISLPLLLLAPFYMTLEVCRHLRLKHLPSSTCCSLSSLCLNCHSAQLGLSF